MAIYTTDFESQHLHMNTRVNVILPTMPKDADPGEWYGSGKEYRVLWLLHGTFGDYSDWVRKSNIELYAARNDLIVVMPSALNSAYTNWARFGQGFAMESFVFDELMPMVRAWLPASDRREDNFVAGLSMGGTGAFQFAVDHADQFAGAMILSSAARNYEELLRTEPPAKRVRFENLIQEAGSLEAFLTSRFNVRHTLENMKPEDFASLPKLFFAYGDRDHGYPAFREFLRFAKRIGLPMTFEVIPGYRHEWRFWDLAIQDGMRFMGMDVKGDPHGKLLSLNGAPGEPADEEV